MIKKKIKTLLLLIILLVIGFTYYHISIVAPNKITTTSYTIKAKNIPSEFNNFKIGYISDFNLTTKEDTTRFKEIISTVKSKNYDMVLFGGDLYTSKSYDVASITKSLQSIIAPYGKFAVLGDKDASNGTIEILYNSGFELLNNQYRTIHKDNQVIHFYGILDNKDLDSLFKDHSEFVFSTAHYPNIFDVTKTLGVQLQLSSHNLGGYVRIPGLGGLIKNDDGNHYKDKFTTEGDQNLVISDGLSIDDKFPIRFNTNNEIVEIILKTQK